MAAKQDFSYLKFTVQCNKVKLVHKIPDFEIDKLTEVEIAFVAFDLINSSTVKQLKAIKGEVLHLAQTHPSLQLPSPWDTCAGTGRQSGRLGSFLKLSHGYRFSRFGPACLARSAT